MHEQQQQQHQLQQQQQHHELQQQQQHHQHQQQRHIINSSMDNNSLNSRSEDLALLWHHFKTFLMQIKLFSSLIFSRDFSLICFMTLFGLG